MFNGLDAWAVSPHAIKLLGALVAISTALLEEIFLLHIWSADMTNKEFLLLETTLLNAFPGFAIKESIMLIPPVERILRGISFEGSTYDKTSFYINSFIMPLCRPTKHLYFNFGDRVRKRSGADRWDISNPDTIKELTSALKHQALPLLARADSLLSFVEMAKSFPGNPRTLEAFAFALARANKNKEAIEALDKLLAELDFNVGWQREIASLANVLRTRISHNPDEIEQQMETWENENVRNLGLENFR